MPRIARDVLLYAYHITVYYGQRFNAHREDDLIDVFEAIGKPKKVHNICLKDDKCFEGGIAIGSPYFRYQIMEKLKGV